MFCYDKLLELINKAFNISSYYWSHNSCL